MEKKFFIPAAIHCLLFITVVREFAIVVITPIFYQSIVPVMIITITDWKFVILANRYN